MNRLRFVKATAMYLGLKACKAILAAGFTAVCFSAVLQAQEQQLRISPEELSRVSESEEQLKRIIQEELDGGNALLLGRSPFSLSGRQAAIMVLDKNLSLKRGRLEDRIAAAALEEARAVFDPVLLLSLAYDRTKTNTRTERADRYQSSTTVNQDGDNVLEVDAAFDPRAPVVVFTEPRNEGFAEDTLVLASQEPITGADESWTLGAALEQVLPWGGNVNLSYQAINKDTFFVNNPQIFSGNPDPPLNLIGFGSYDRPWVSELIASLQMPLPGTKDFGRYSSQRLNRSRATLARESAEFDLKSLINQSLLQADDAYWLMVESALGVQVVRESLNAARALVDSTQRLYRGRSANNYDLAQAELSLTNTRAREEQIWSNYVQASDRLALLLNLPADSLIIPDGFSDVVALDETPGKAAENAIRQHPDYLAEKALNERAALDSEAGKQSVKPDLQLELELQLRQSNQVYGYESFGDSLSSVFEPDIFTQRIGLNYQLPFGNRGLKAASRSADAAHRQSGFNLAASHNALQSELNRAQARLEGAQINVAYFAEAERLAALSYEKALDRQRARQVREYELAGQHEQLLNARLAYISALIAVKRAETALLEAQGVLHEEHADRLTRSPIEKWRLSLLQNSGALRIFLPGGKVQ